jgi:argininosuccinate lyase
MTPKTTGTLWSSGAPLNGELLEFTTRSDRPWDSRLLRWDVLGSLGHVEGLAASGLVRPGEHRRLRSALRSALRAVDQGKLRLQGDVEDVHTAVEEWIVRKHGPVGESLHTGRSRNDQVCCDLRLYLKDQVLAVHQGARQLVDQLLAFAGRERRQLWPGYTHTRRAMPSSAALWAAGLAEGLLDSLETTASLWSQVDRSPLGTAAGYGVPLPLKREVTARALGFGGLNQVATTPQGGRGKVEAAALFWCVQLGHDLARLAADVILFSAEEFGYLVLPARSVTGSSIMPHKRNPDVFELVRGNVAALEGDLHAILALRGKLTGGYHRDFQLLKEPLMRGLERTLAGFRIVGAIVPGLTVDRERAAAAMAGSTLATDEVMRRVENGRRFRSAYREVAQELKEGHEFPAPSPGALLARRRSTGGLGNLGLPALARRSRTAARWERQQRRPFERALARLGGR